MSTGTQFTKKYSLWFVLGLAAGLRVWHINWGLPELYEEAFPLSISWKFWNWGNPGFDFDPHFFHYPALTFYLNFVIQFFYFLIGYIGGFFPNLAAFQRAFETDPTVFILSSRLISVLFDVGTVYILYKFGEEILNEQAGLLAGLFGAISPLLIKQSHLVNVDTPLAFFSILTLLFLYRLSKSRERKWYILSGVCIGLAASSKYNGALLVVILIAVHFFTRQSFRDAVAFQNLRPLFHGMILSGVIFLITNPFTLINFIEFYDDFRFEEMHMEVGHLGADPSVKTWEFYFLHALPESMGWPIFLVSVTSLVYVYLDKRKIFFSVALFPVLYLIVINTWNMRADRYVLPVIPSFILLASFGMILLWKYIVDQKIITKLLPAFDSWLGRLPLVIITVFLLLLQPIVAAVSYHRSVALPDTRAVMKDWIQNHVPQGSIIATIPMGINLPDSIFNVFPLPFLSVNAEKVVALYDTRWYEEFDLIIGSSYDYDRYAIDTVRYRGFLAYYDSLRIRWKLIAKVIPEESQPGPSIWLYKSPSVSKNRPFPSELFEKLQSTPESSRVSNFLANLTKTAFQKGNLVKAEQLLREILGVEMHNMEARDLLINLLLEQGRLVDAIEPIREYLNLNPNHAPMLLLQGNVLLRMNNIIEAELSLQRALRNNGQLSAAYDYLLYIYVQRRDKSKAIDILSRHLAILPKGSEKARLVSTDLNKLKNMQ